MFVVDPGYSARVNGWAEAKLNQIALEHRRVVQETMAVYLNRSSTTVKWGVLRNGPRVFALLGKATPSGLVPFTKDDAPGALALTAEYGCLRLERLTGYEEVTGDHFFLPTPFSYDYGVIGSGDSPEVTRSIFGLLPSELDHLIAVLRKGSFPVLGYSHTEMKCSLTSSIIPAHWPHLVVSNLALYGNVVSVEAFLRLVVSSLPQSHLSIRYPSLQNVVKQMLKLLIVQRRGLPYCKEALEGQPTSALATK